MNSGKSEKRKSAFKAGLAVFFYAGLMLTAQEHDWDKAERKIKRLPPSVFQGLPTRIQKQLEDRGCTIPQADFSAKLHNVIQGEFARKRQKDWAVLCSREGRSSILVFWEKPSSCPTEIGEAEDKNFLQGWSGGRIVYSRMLDSATADYIREHYERYGGTKPPQLDHQGIDDAFMGKASIVWYCHKGEWLRLTGAD